jgi:hypothetical protein
LKTRSKCLRRRIGRTAVELDEKKIKTNTGHTTTVVLDVYERSRSFRITRSTKRRNRDPDLGWSRFATAVENEHGVTVRIVSPDKLLHNNDELTE